ncbi:zinc finger protein 208-like [Anopheles albimanus]|uniref:zinc finger protein 208-like n=1 Tax=Anopheles albimanus TaxID=7167 RepID=UPI00163E1E41|nr:zinc finger protein 208-like [Anopheles albimanus]
MARTGCEVCLSQSKETYLDIFAEENSDKQIALIISKYLWFEVKPVPEESTRCICSSCWLSLEQFHDFYTEIQRAQAIVLVHSTDAATDAGNKSECILEDSATGKIHPEFYEVKVEPTDNIQEGVNEEETEDHCTEKPLACVFVKCEGLVAPDPTAQSGEEEEEDILLEQQQQPMEEEEEEEEQTVESSEDCSTAGEGTSKGKRTRKPTTDQDSKARKVEDQQREDEELLRFYKRIVCETCDNQRMMAGEPQIDYGTWRALLRHTKECHGHDKIYVKCPVCEVKLRTKFNLLQHMEMHENPEKYRCKLCSEVHQNMKEHMQNKHQERQFCCDVCGKKFPFKKRLTVHIKKMHVEKDIICEQCQKPFTRYTIEDHRRSVHTARFVCEHCPKTFNSRFRLRQHMEEHDESLRNSTSVPCTVCGQVMRDKYILSRHVKLMHTVQPSVSCTTCGKTFKCKRNLSVHMANVCLEPTRLFPCTVCGKEFRRKNKLKEHMTTHTGRPLYMCSFCPETFRQDTHLYYHRKNAHYEQWLEMQKQRKEGVRFRLNELSSLWIYHNGARGGICFGSPCESEQSQLEAGTAMECQVCYRTNETEYLDIHAKEHIEKRIATLITQHLCFELLPSVDTQFICAKCWTALDEFHRFYSDIEAVHRARIEDDECNKHKVESPGSACQDEPTYTTEFLEIKDEPMEEEEEQGDGDEPFDLDAVDKEEPPDMVDSDAPEDDEEEEEEEKDCNDEEGDATSSNDRKPSKTELKTARRKKETTRSRGKPDHTEPKRKPASESVPTMDDGELLEFYKRIVCEVCDNQRMMRGEPLIDFGSWTALLRHSKEVHGHYKIFVQCPICGCKMRTKVTLWQHMDMHKHPDKYRCKVCSEVHQNMKEHMQNKHEERQYSCDLCGSKFPFKKRLVVHMKKMHAEKDVPCDQCQKSFTKYTIEDHKRSVHMARFVCEHCPKTFKIRFRLLKHMQEHDKSLRVATSVPCHICGQVMGDKYILSQHIKHMHAEQQSVNCDTCGKTFKNKRNLTVHLANVCMKLARMHPCSICDKQFRNLNRLKDHMATCTPI